MNLQHPKQAWLSVMVIVLLCLVLAGCGQAGSTNAVGSTDDGLAESVVLKNTTQPISVEIEENKPSSPIDGMVFTSREAGHKHADDGHTAVRFEVIVQKGMERVESSYLLTPSEPWNYAEGIAFGRVYSIAPLLPIDYSPQGASDPEEQTKYGKLLVTVFPEDFKSKSSDGSQMIQLVKAKASELGLNCESSRWTVSKITDGSYALSAIVSSDETSRTVCQAVVGVYTGSVFVHKLVKPIRAKSKRLE